MSPERWRQVKLIFHDAVEKPPEERSAFLQEVCVDDDALRAEVERLLASDERGETLLSDSVPEILNEVLAPQMEVGRRLGAYRVVRELGRGGMAVVYAAVRDDDQYEKQVAIKLIKRGMDTDAIIARFRQERQILARLEHPSIARLVDGGMTDDGLPFLVMELVEGTPIDAYCEQRRLTTEERVELFRSVGSAVQYAHRNLVVHRDLKPSNILVTTEGEVKLLDFGIAKLLEPGHGTLPATGLGWRPMTPDYASPEQVRGEPVTAATDVYALGVLLYQLLAGRQPYQIQSLTPREIERVVCDEKIAPVSSFCPEIAADLDNIVAMAMHKSPDQRYGSVDQFSEDLRRFLEGLPISATRDSLAYRTGKFLRRHRWGVAATCLVILSLLGGLIATAWQAKVAREERKHAEWVSSFLTELFWIPQLSRAEGETVTALKLLERGAKQIEHELDLPPKVRAKLLDQIGKTYLFLGVFDQAAPLLEEALDLRQGLFGNDHLETAASLQHVGQLRYAEQNLDDAANKFRQALDLRRRHLGADHELVVESRNSLALVLFEQGDDDRAEELLRMALDRPVDSRGDHPETARTLNNLALVLKDRGKLEEAVALYRQALEMNRRLFGRQHPDMTVYLNNFASVLKAWGRCSEAIKYYEEALSLRIRLSGESHPEVALFRSNLAGCHKDEGEFEIAESLYVESLDLARQTWGEAHPFVAQILNNLGEIFRYRRELEKAESTFREVIDIYANLPGEKRPEEGVALANLGLVLFDLRDVEDAEHYQRVALDHFELSSDRPLMVAGIRHSLAQTLRRRHQAEGGEELLQEAEHLLRKALVTRSDSLGEKNFDVANTTSALGRVLLGRGKLEEAAEVLKNSLDLLSSWPERRWAMIAVDESQLGGCLVDLGRLQEAAPLLEKSYQTFRQRLGDEHNNTIRTRRHLERLRKAGGQLDDER